MYSGRIPDQEIHPGISKSIILSESIFPQGIFYNVHLVNNDQIEHLPWWITYISNERKLLMFPSASEVAQDFTIRISGYNGGTTLESEFSIKVRNKDPISVIDLVDQRVKLGTPLDYQIPDDSFVDEDEDPLNYSVKWVKEDGSESSSLPSWISFVPASRAFYGDPDEEGNFTLALIVADDYGGSIRKEFKIEAYNHSPSENSNKLQDQTVHIGDSLVYIVAFDLFSDEDGDVLSFEASQKDGSSLPSWLKFSPSNLQLSLIHI